MFFFIYLRFASKQQNTEINRENLISMEIQSNSVITNSLGPVKFVRYNREFILTGVIYVLYIGFGTKKSVRYNRRFVITEFHCISTVETKILKVSRLSRLWRLTFWQCWDRESRSRHNRDKSRPAGLEIIQKTVCRILLLSQQYNDDTITQGNPI